MFVYVCFLVRYYYVECTDFMYDSIKIYYILCAQLHIFQQTTNQKLMFQKKTTDMNMDEIACFLALLMGLRSHKTCNQRNIYMEMCRTILCINICNLFHAGVRG